MSNVACEALHCPLSLPAGLQPCCQLLARGNKQRSGAVPALALVVQPFREAGCSGFAVEMPALCGLLWLPLLPRLLLILSTHVPTTCSSLGCSSCATQNQPVPHLP